MGDQLEPIGPFSLGRNDQLAAASLISFSLGSRPTRIWSWVLLVVPVAAAVVIALSGDRTGGLVALLLPAFLFVVAPLLRSNKRSRAIVISASGEGLVLETADVRTTYKWATLGSVRYFRRRLFVMITGNCALVIPERATTPSNLAALAQLITQNQQGS
jgi:hypothetical protein